MKSPFLLYHKIDLPPADARVRGAYTPPKTFEKQLRYLTRNGVGFMTAAEMVRHFRTNGEFPSKTVAITFDDGWKDNYRNAFPLLQKYGIPATIFLVTSCIGQTTDKVVAEGEGPREHLSIDDIREMSAAGIEFGSHTVNHRLFDQIDEIDIDRELTESKSAIESITQKPCETFAYPAGKMTPYAIVAAPRAGYTAGFATDEGNNNASDLYKINRVEILRRDRWMFRFRKKMGSMK